MNCWSQIVFCFFSFTFVSLPAQQLITKYSVDEGLPPSTVTSLYRDNDGYLWCGTPLGLKLFNGAEFRSAQNSSEKTSPSLSGPIHGIVASTDKRTIWVGTDSVIVQIDRSSLKPIRSFDVIKSLGTIESPLIANDTAVWVGCSGLGLYRVRISDGKVTRLTSSGCRPETQTVVYNNSIACFADSSRQIVFLSITTDVLWTAELPVGLNPDQLNSIVELPNADKSVLLLTAKGLWQCEYSTRVVAKYHIDLGTIADTLVDFISMTAHPDGNFWFATSSDGTYQYNPRTQESSRCCEQIGDSTCGWQYGVPTILICDEYGVVWCGTADHGLLKMVHGRYGSSPLSGVGERICFRSSVVVASYPQNAVESGCIEESIIRDYPAEPIVISLWQTDFAFSDEVKFSWHVEGLDEPNSSHQGLRNVTINPTAPGFYSFTSSVQVPGCDNTATSKLFTIKVVPPFWMAGWFIGVASLTIILFITLLLFVSMRRKYQRNLHKLRMQQELDKVRARISRDIHDDIGAGLTRIALSGELMAQKSSTDAQHQEKLKVIAGTARELSQSMKEVVWSVNPHYDSLDHMSAYFRSYVAGVAENADLRFKYVADENIPTKEVNPETRRNLLLILKETISNAVKYSGCTELKLEIHWAHEKFTMKISDNGSGFDPEANDKVNSNGLRNIRQRAEASGGTVKFHSESGKGTSVEVMCPVVGKE